MDRGAYLGFAGALWAVMTIVGIYTFAGDIPAEAVPVAESRKTEPAPDIHRAARLAAPSSRTVPRPAAKRRFTPADPRMAGRGRNIYKRHCASCHGRRLEGERNWRRLAANGRMRAPPHDASGHTWQHTDDYLFRIVRDGGRGLLPPGYRSNMPAFKGRLSEREIRDVLSFIKSHWPPGIRASQEALHRGARTARSKR